MSKLRPGQVRDVIEQFLSMKENEQGATLAQMTEYIDEEIGVEVPRSSIRSYLNLNTPGRFERTARGAYRMAGGPRE